MEDLKKNIHIIMPLLVALIAALISYSVLKPVLYDDSIVQDDFRQSFFWFWQYWDPELLPDDFFKKIYASNSIRTPLFLLIFKLAPFFTDNLVFFSKLFPIFISSISALYAYLFFEKLLQHSQQEPLKPEGDFLNKLFALVFAITLSFVFWSTDHLPAMCPRSFVWLGLLAYMYYKLIARNISAAIFCFLLLLLSPNTFLICMAMEFYHLILRLKSTKSLTKTVEFFSLVFNGLATIILYKLLFRNIQTQGFGKAFTVAEMRSMPEFNPGGRHPIFASNIWDGSWWMNEHWGLGIGWLKISQLIPWVLVLTLIYFAAHKLLASKGTQFLYIEMRPLVLLFVASISLYVLSQMIFPVLYMPSRYIGIPWLLLSVVFAILITRAFLIDLWSFLDLESFKQTEQAASKLKLIFFSSILVLLLLLEWQYAPNFYRPNWTQMTETVRKALLATPINSVIAAHPQLPDINSCDIIAKRNAFVDYERSMTYCHESQSEIRRRNMIALSMVYAATKEDLLDLMKSNGISHILVHQIFYSPEYLSQERKYIEPYNQYIDALTKNGDFYLAKLLKAYKNNYLLLSRENLEKI